MPDKNLLIITNNYPNEDNSYVAEIFVKEQVKYLQKYFKNIYVISPVAYGLEKLRKTSYENYQYDNVKVFFPKYFNIPLFYTYSRSLWTYFETKAMLNLINKEGIGFDLIHAHFTWPSGSVAVEFKKYYDVPVVITEHTSTTFKRAIDNKDETFIKTWHKCDAIIRVRSSDMSSFEEVGIPKNKVFHIPNGFSSNKFFKTSMLDCRKKLDLPLDKKIILNVGNLYGEVKGHRYLVEAMNEIAKHRDDVLCVLVGKGKLENIIQEQINALNLEKFIKLVGGKSHDEIPLWMNACDLFVLPSLNEGNPTVLVECLGCGKPFVGTKVGGVPEIITSDDYGLLVEPGDSQDLAEKIEIALNKDWDIGKIKEYGNNFTWENIASQIVEVYDSVSKE